MMEPSRPILSGRQGPAALQNACLYGILDLGYVNAGRALPVARQLLEGGVQVLQLRAKETALNEIAGLAGRLAPLCREHGVPFIINDHPALVRETGADGAHVGQDDMSVAEARRLAGPGKIIGKSTHSLAQAEAAAGESPDYIGFGPLFATPTKSDYRPIGLKEIAEVHRRIPLPIFCIGGIKQDNLPSILAAGVTRVVIVSGLLQAENIRLYAAECLRALNANAIRQTS